MRNSVQLKHELKRGRGGGGDRWMKESLVQQRTSSLDCLWFFPSLFISSSMRWQREYSLPGQILSLLGHSTLGKWSVGVHSLKCWFRDLPNHCIKIQVPRPPPTPPESHSGGGPRKPCILSSQCVNHHLKYSIMWKKSALLKILWMLFLLAFFLPRRK